MAGLLFLASCSVKEDREPCPCLLELNIDGHDMVPSGPVDILVTSQDGFMQRDTLDFWREEGLYSLSVPRTDLHVRAWCGGGKYVSKEGMRIPLGNECPRVYMHDSDVTVEGEYFREDVYLRKNHCVLTILIEGGESGFSDLVLKGNVAGYDMVGKPLAGDFEYSPVMETDGDKGLVGYEAVLPRQKDDSLMLDLEDSKGNPISFSLGRYISASGYDWSSHELDDLTVTLDYALTEIRLEIDGWESVYRYDVEI